MRLLAILFLIAGCGKVTGNDRFGIYINMTGNNYAATAHALAQLQLQSKNMDITFGTADNHSMQVEYARNDQVANLFNNGVLGVAWIYEKPCRIQMVERTYGYGQDLVNSVLWHEIGHCLGMKHHPDADDIMHQYAKPLSKYSESAVQNFFRRLYEATR
jgi:predicted Zn-dependent protease